MYILTPAQIISYNRNININGLNDGAGGGGTFNQNQSGTRTLTVGNANANGSFSGTIIGSFALTKTGTGTQILSGVNTYTRGTTITSGTLKLVGSGNITTSALFDVAAGTFDVSAVAPFTLGSGKTLRGNGTVLGSMLVQGIVGPGESPGTLTVGNMTFDSNSTLNIELSSAVAFDVLNSTGSLTLQPSSTLNVSLINSYVPSGGETFDILNFTSELGQFVVNLPTLSPGLTWDTSDLYIGGSITVLVPEPATLVLLTMGALMLLLRRRR